MLVGSAARSAAIRAATESLSAGLVGPRFEPGGRGSVICVGSGGGRAAPEVPPIGKRLADELGANDTSVVAHKRAVRLMMERGTWASPVTARGYTTAREDREKPEQNEGRVGAVNAWWLSRFL